MTLYWQSECPLLIVITELDTHDRALFKISHLNQMCSSELYLKFSSEALGLLNQNNLRPESKHQWEAPFSKDGGSQVPVEPTGGEAAPTCDRSFPWTRMLRQTSSRRASPDSILSCGHRNVQAVTQTDVHTESSELRLSASFLASAPLRVPKKKKKKTLSPPGWFLWAPLVNWAGGGAARGGKGRLELF